MGGRGVGEGGKGDGVGVAGGRVGVEAGVGERAAVGGEAGLAAGRVAVSVATDCDCSWQALQRSITINRAYRRAESDERMLTFFMDVLDHQDTHLVYHRYRYASKSDKLNKTLVDIDEEKFSAYRQIVDRIKFATP